MGLTLEALSGFRKLEVIARIFYFIEFFSQISKISIQILVRDSKR